MLRAREDGCSTQEPDQFRAGRAGSAMGQLLTFAARQGVLWPRWRREKRVDYQYQDDRVSWAHGTAVIR